MATLIADHKYFFLCILANVMFFWLTWVMDGRFHITMVHAIFGILPLLIQTFRSYKRIYK
jgi:hypothetical protein